MALNPGQTSDLVKSQFGYHIIQTEEKKQAGTQPLAEVKDSIVQVLQQQKQAGAVQAFGQQLVAEAAKNGLDKMAAAHGLRAETTDYVARGGIVGGVSDSTGLLNSAFAAAKGAAPAEVSTGDGYAIFQVVDVKPAHAPLFADWKSHLLEDFREQAAPAMLSTQLNKLDLRAKQLNDLKKAADKMHPTVKTSDLVGQEGQVPDLGAMSGPGSVAFTLPKGAISGPINTGSNGIVLTVTDKLEPSAEEMAKNFAQMKDQLLRQQQQEVYQVFVETLADKYEKAGAVHYAKAPPKPASPGM
jgi:peptidyl-prolyl cis-trans isomerase D